MQAFEILTYGNVETLEQVLNAVAATVHSRDFSGLIKLVFLLGLMLWMASFALYRQLAITRWFIHALIFTTLLNLPVATVLISSKDGMQTQRAVKHVPYMLALVAHANSLVFTWLTQQYETSFKVPDGLGLGKGDVGFGHRLLRQVKRTRIADPYLHADLIQFFKECTLYDFRDGVVTESDFASADPWKAILDKANPARFVTYDTLMPKPQLGNCQDVAKLLGVRIQVQAREQQSFLARLFFASTRLAEAQNYFRKALSDSYTWILKSSLDASASLRQAMFNNLWKDAAQEIPAILNDPARVSEVTAIAAATQAAVQNEAGSAALSLLAQESIPHLRNWIEAIIYALFPVVVVLIVCLSPEAARSLMAGYLMALVWIGLWPLLFAVINHLSLLHLQHKAQAWGLHQGIPMPLADAFEGALVTEQSFIGYMLMAVPFIAGTLVRMGHGGFMNMADRFTSGASSAGSAAAANWSTGNVHLGETGIDNASVNMTTMNKFDNEPSYMSGNRYERLQGGGLKSINAFGSSVVRSFDPEAGNTVQQHLSVSHNANQETRSASTEGTGYEQLDAQTERVSLGSTDQFRAQARLSQSTGEMTSTGTRDQKGQSSRDSKATGSSKTEDQHSDGGISASVGVRGGLGGGGGGIGVGGSIEGFYNRGKAHHEIKEESERHDEDQFAVHQKETGHDRTKTAGNSGDLEISVQKQASQEKAKEHAENQKTFHGAQFDQSQSSGEAQQSVKTLSYHLGQLISNEKERTRVAAWKGYSLGAFDNLEESQKRVMAQDYLHSEQFVADHREELGQIGWKESKAEPSRPSSAEVKNQSPLTKPDLEVYDPELRQRFQNMLSTFDQKKPWISHATLTRYRARKKP